MNEVLDVSPFAEAKSDRLCGDDLLGGPRTIIVTKVTADDAADKASIHFEGDGGKPFMPCKTMLRVLMSVWTKYGNTWVGKSMTVYRDPKVTFGAAEMGGVRISHVSDIDSPVSLHLAKAKGRKGVVRVDPLKAAAEPSAAQSWADGYTAAVHKASTPGELEAFATSKAPKLAELARKRPDLHSQCVGALAARREFFAPSEDFAGDDFSSAEEDHAAHDPETGEVFERDAATGMTVVDEETARALDAGADDSSEEAHAEPAAQPHWQAAVDKALGGIRAAKNLSYLTSVEDAWLGARAGVSDPSVQKRVDDMIDVARRELRAPV